MNQDYKPAKYWSDLLATDFSLRGVGHSDYRVSYNRWMYRWKRHVVRRALRSVGRGRTALDIGSGIGWVVNELLRTGARIEGSDIAETAIELLRMRFPSVPFFRTTFGSEVLPRPNDAYDLVTILEVVFHVTDDDQWASGIAEIGRVLCPGGRLIVTDGFGASDRDPAPHVRFRSIARWQPVASAAGLRFVAIRPCYRWLSRDLHELWFPNMPHRVRGALEYALEVIAPRSPHMRIAILEKV
jgi:SAM-dependent methyltransferase